MRRSVCFQVESTSDCVMYVTCVVVLCYFCMGVCDSDPPGMPICTVI